MVTPLPRRPAVSRVPADRYLQHGRYVSYEACDSRQVAAAQLSDEAAVGLSDIEVASGIDGDEQRSVHLGAQCRPVARECAAEAGHPIDDSRSDLTDLAPVREIDVSDLVHSGISGEVISFAEQNQMPVRDQNLVRATIPHPFQAAPRLILCVDGRTCQDRLECK